VLDSQIRHRTCLLFWWGNRVIVVAARLGFRPPPALLFLLPLNRTNLLPVVPSPASLRRPGFDLLVWCVDFAHLVCALIRFGSGFSFDFAVFVYPFSICPVAGSVVIRAEVRQLVCLCAMPQIQNTRRKCTLLAVLCGEFAEKRQTPAPLVPDTKRVRLSYPFPELASSGRLEVSPYCCVVW
jgi:hypothetical protein